jgi:hypothetical protein
VGGCTRVAGGVGVRVWAVGWEDGEGGVYGGGGTCLAGINGTVAV